MEQRHQSHRVSSMWRTLELNSSFEDRSHDDTALPSQARGLQSRLSALGVAAVHLIVTMTAQHRYRQFPRPSPFPTRSQLSPAQSHCLSVQPCYLPNFTSLFTNTARTTESQHNTTQLPVPLTLSASKSEPNPSLPYFVRGRTPFMTIRGIIAPDEESFTMCIFCGFVPRFVCMCSKLIDVPRVTNFSQAALLPLPSLVTKRQSLSKVETLKPSPL